MKVLVIGSGGREHALVWKISKSKKVAKIYCAPGSPGTAQIAKNISINPDQLNLLVKLVKKEKIDLTIVGPEIPLIGGIVDLFEKNNLNIIGPNIKAAQIEGSKVFSKKLMLKYGIPTALFAVFDDYPLALKFIKTQKYPLVIKADGQCAGKGVVVCQNVKEASIFVTTLMKDKIFGISGNKIVIEECLEGPEVSFMVATDGNNFISLLPSQDHKRIYDNDRGPNTGGMGAYTPIPYVGRNLIKRIETEIVGPTLRALKKEGCIYKGILYPGLILTRDGPKVLEFNCRFGDPETQPLMMMLKSDIIELFEAIINKRINKYKLKWYKGASVCVVLASRGYPGIYEKGKVIKGLEKYQDLKDVCAFHAGTNIIKGKITNSGGRVLGITARGKNLSMAIKNVYKIVGDNGISFSGMQYRKDIGRKGLNKSLWII